MREARARDYRRKAMRMSCPTRLESIEMRGFRGVDESLEFSGGLTVFCGLNGVGKSTIISAVKWITGQELSDRDMLTLGGRAFAGRVVVDDVAMSNFARESGSDLLNRVTIVDCARAVEAQRSILSQMNFEEVLDQYETIMLSEEWLESLRFLTSKSYEECTLTVIDDEALPNGGALPFFAVQEKGGACYDSRSMGTGEHSLFYLYYILATAPEKSITVIEEPESFISVQSQRNLMDCICQIMATKQMSVIVTTHSPAVIEYVECANVRIVSRMNSRMYVSKPLSKTEIEEALDLRHGRKITVLVEDTIAKESLLSLLGYEDPRLRTKVSVEKLDGFGNICDVLSAVSKVPSLARTVIGVFDGDMRDKDCLVLPDNAHVFYLPYDKGFEEELKTAVQNDEKLAILCKALSRDVAEVRPKLGKTLWKDPHDWLYEFSEILGIDVSRVVAVYQEAFIDDIKRYSHYSDFLSFISYVTSEG